MANRTHSSPGHTRHFERILYWTAEVHRGEPDGSSKIGSYPINFKTCHLFSGYPSCDRLSLCLLAVIAVANDSFSTCSGPRGPKVRPHRICIHMLSSHTYTTTNILIGLLLYINSVPIHQSLHTCTTSINDHHITKEQT